MSHQDQLIDEARPFFADPGTFGWNLVSTRLTQFPYFDQLLDRPVWRGRKILDFGGNVGTFLQTAGGNVDHEDYWCVDINRAVVEQGRRMYPRANFVHFNRYGPQYNPAGIRNLAVPDCGTKFDFILAFSVFTHIDLYETVELVQSLRELLANDGTLAFTFYDPRYDRSRSDSALPPGTMVLPNLGSPGDHETVRQAKWLVLINNKLYVEPGSELCHQTRHGKPFESYCSFFTTELVMTLFAGAIIREPVQREWQHCCILRSLSLMSSPSQK